MKKKLLIVAIVATCAVHTLGSVEPGEPVIDGNTHLEPGGDDGPAKPPPPPPSPIR